MKYLNAVLTVIAVCLVLITFAVTGLIPAARAGSADQRFLSVPVNADGSVNVNIEAIGGSRSFSSELPISVKSPIDVNLEEINGHSTNFTPLRVRVEK